MGTANAQFGIDYSLSVLNDSIGLDLSGLRFKFSTKSMDVETPNTATIRVYNPSPQTISRLWQGEFSKVSISGGYKNGINYGLLFQGDIMHVHKGRERNVDGYVEILAADGDQLYTFATTAAALGPGSTPQQRFEAVTQKLSDYGVTLAAGAANAFANTGGILPRGVVLFGMFRAAMRDLCTSAQTRWSVQNGVLTVIPNTGYLPDEAVELNSSTGLLGTPEATDSGVNVRLNINARLQIGGLVKISSDLVNQQLVLKQGYPNYNSLYYPAQAATDNIYRILMMTHMGDTRGPEWFTDLVCLAMSPVGTSAVASAYPG